jgi:thymidine kinase
MGQVEVIAGGMFSGKTEELLRLLRRAKYARQSVMLFKPTVDGRYSETDVVSHVGGRLESIVAGTALEIERRVPPETQVVGIDEAQFFNGELVSVCNRLADKGVRVIVAGLDMDWEGKPYGPIPHLMAVSESVTKLRAICIRCGKEAGFSYRKTGGTEQTKVGGPKDYEAQCRDCFRSNQK